MENKEKVIKKTFPGSKSDKKKLIELIEESLNFNNYVIKNGNRNMAVEIAKRLARSKEE